MDPESEAQQKIATCAPSLSPCLPAHVCGFTTMAESIPPNVIVHILSSLVRMRKFDELITESSFLYKLNLIGDW